MSAQKLITEHLDLWTGAIARKSSSGRGNNSKFELAGIRKLRELILELAVRGKLVEQNPEDEPASTLLSRVVCERATLVEKGALKKPRIPKEQLHRYEPPFGIPNSWKWSPLDDLAPTPLFDGDWIESKDQDPNGSIRLLQLADIGIGEFKDASDKHISVEAFKRLNCSKVLPGDVLIARLPSPIGRAAIFPGLEKECITAVDVAILRASGILNSRYIVYALNSPTSRTQVESYGKGATRFRISTGHLKTVLIPVAPLSEQHRIVQKVDELMALCDRLEQQTSDQLEAHETLVDTLLGTLTQSESATDLADNWARLAAHFDTLFATEQSIDKLKQTILHLAVIGRLVEQNTGDAQAEELVIRAAQAKNRLKLQGSLRKSRDVEIAREREFAHKLPHSWRHVRVSDLFHLQNGYAFKSPWFTDKGARLLRNVNISHGFINWDETVFLPEEMAIDFERFALKAGDLVISLDRPLISTGLKYAIIRESDTPCLLLQRVARFQQYHEVVHLRFFEYWLNSELFTSVIDPGRSNGVPHISTGQIEALSFPLPPANEQIRIVQKVDNLIALCDKLKERLNEASDTRCQLADAIVEGALH